MMNSTRATVLAIFVLIIIFTVWSKLRFLDDDAQEPQRWRLDEYPDFKQKSG